jgi:hypothetical protein
VGCSHTKEIWAGFTLDHSSLAQVVEKDSPMHSEGTEATIALACYAAWHLRKERGRYVFEGQEMAAQNLVKLVRDDSIVVSTAFLLYGT